METVIKRMYEGLFLVDSAFATADWQRVIATIERVLNRADADIVSMKKWDERRLTYEINKKSRGTYILAYFNVDPLRVKDIERDVQLSEDIMRVLILRTDRMSDEDLARLTPLEAAEKAEAEGSISEDAPVADVETMEEEETEE